MSCPSVHSVCAVYRKVVQTGSGTGAHTNNDDDDDLARPLACLSFHPPIRAALSLFEDDFDPEDNRIDINAA